MGYKMIPIDPSRDQRWDNFVQQHPMGSVYHQSAWINLIASTFLYRPHCYALIEEATGSCKGLFPLMAPCGLFNRGGLVSLPYATYCDPLVPHEIINESLEYILKDIPEYQLVELRLRLDHSKLSDTLGRDHLYINHTIDLSEGLDAVFDRFHYSCVKRKIQKAQKSNLTFRFSETEEDIKEIYDLLLVMRKTKGLPPHPYRFFVNLWKVLGPLEMCYAPYVVYEDKIVSAAIILKFKDTIYYEYAASDPQYQNLGASQFLIWEIIKFGIVSGAQKLDLGRSHPDNHSLIQFKDRWGGTKKVITYCHYPKRQQKSTMSNALVSWGNYVNKRLPKPVLRLEGEFIYRYLR